MTIKISITIDEAIIVEKLLLEVGTIQPQEVIDLEKKIRKTSRLLLHRCQSVQKIGLTASIDGT